MSSVLLVVNLRLCLFLETVISLRRILSIMVLPRGPQLNWKNLQQKRREPLLVISLQIPRLGHRLS